jgi:hypothetical protein
MLISLHIYHEPAQLYPSLVKKTGGGEGPIYLATVGIQLAARKEKQDEKNEQDQILPEGKSYSGVTLRMLTVKNRFIPPFLAIENFLSYKTGLDKYSGLFEMAENHGIIVKDGHRYNLFDGTKLGFYSEFRHNVDIWENKIIPPLNEKIKQAYRYNSAVELPEKLLEPKE